MGREKHKWRDYYDEAYFERGVGSPYGRKISSYSEAEAEIRRYCISYLNLADKYSPIRDGRSKWALEIGCAYGYGLKLLEELGYKACGIDISEYAIKQAKGSLENSAGNVAVANGQRVPFKESSFDLVVSFDLMEHLPYPEQMVADCYHLLKARGLFIAVTPNNISPLYKMGIFFNKMPSHINVRSPWNWRRVFKEYDWQGLKILFPQWLPKIQRKINLPYVSPELLIIACK